MKRGTQRKQFQSVAEAMEVLGLKDADVAADVRCHSSWIAKLRTGTKYPCLTMPLRIAKRLNVPIEKLSADDAA